MKKSKKGFKISTLIFILIIIFGVLLVILAFQENPSNQVISIFSDILKILAGALAGAIVGEKER